MTSSGEFKVLQAICEPKRKSNNVTTRNNNVFQTSNIKLQTDSDIMNTAC